MSIEGIIPAVITPFDGEQNINYDATATHLDNLIARGVHGLFILGTNGEFHVLSDDEKVSFAQFVVSHVNKRIPVIVGVGACGTLETIRLVERMDEIGADAFSVITPYLVKVTQDELVHHYTMIAEASKTPIMLYNIPANTGISIEPATLKTLTSIKRIIGIKDSSGNIDTIEGYIEATKGTNVKVYIGSDSKILEGLKRGAHGAVASTANVITEHVVSVLNTFKKGDIETAEKLQKDIDVIRGVFKHASVPGMVKRCITVRDQNVGEPRFPVKPVGNTFDKEVKDMLMYYNIA